MATSLVLPFSSRTLYTLRDVGDVSFSSKTYVRPRYVYVWALVDLFKKIPITNGVSIQGNFSINLQRTYYYKQLCRRTCKRETSNVGKTFCSLICICWWSQIKYYYFATLWLKQFFTINFIDCYSMGSQIDIFCYSVYSGCSGF
jgi:hypothetical protein